MAGFWETILSRVQPVSVFTPRVTHISGNDELAAYYGLGGASVAQVWRSQPHLRTVASFLCRNVAQLGVHTFERVDETDRKRDRSSATARALMFPDVGITTYDLIYALVGDMLLYDRAYWYVTPSMKTKSGWMIRRLPPSWVDPDLTNPFEPASYRVTLDGKDAVTIPAAQIVDFTGYSPSHPGKGSPTVESLRETLQEQVEAAKYRGQVWRRGGRVSSVLQRPQNAPPWSDGAREAFREDWYAKYTGRGSKAGGTPILEDGMTLQRVDFNAQEQQFVEAAKLSLVTVAAAFHVNPTMIGQNDGANYSNVREFRRMLYGDTLGPLLAQIEARLNAFLLPLLGTDPERFYVEFNIAEKLQGSFEEQSAAMQTAVGGPWMTRAEARARQNLPAIDGADGLIVPLNVLVGGQASPNDSGSQNLNGGAAPSMKGRSVRVKARMGEQYEQKHQEVLAAFFKRQGAAVLSRLGAKADSSWWDRDRWDDELAGDLTSLGLMTSEAAGKAALEQAGREGYDTDRTVAYVRTVARAAAEAINETTRLQVEAALDDDEPDAVAHVFDVAKDSRSQEMAATLVTGMSGFGVTEAARQTSDAATKTWIVTSTNPRASHAAMNGETVGIDDAFSNGMSYPASGGDPAEVANCRCEVEIQF